MTTNADITDKLSLLYSKSILSDEEVLVVEQALDLGSTDLICRALDVVSEVDPKNTSRLFPKADART